MMVGVPAVWNGMRGRFAVCARVVSAKVDGSGGILKPVVNYRAVQTEEKSGAGLVSAQSQAQV